MVVLSLSGGRDAEEVDSTTVLRRASLVHDDMRCLERRPTRDLEPTEIRAARVLST